MSATKGIIPGIRTLVRYLFRPLEGNAWVLAITIVTCSILGISSYHLWKRYGDTIIGHPRYRLDPEHLWSRPNPPGSKRTSRPVPSRMVSSATRTCWTRNWCSR